MDRPRQIKNEVNLSVWNSDYMSRCHNHGPIMYVRLGLVPTIVTSSADAAEKVLKTYDHIFASKPHHEASQYLSYGQKNLILPKYGAYWRNMRKLFTIHAFQSMRKKEVDFLIESLKREGKDRVVVDLSAKITSLNTNLTCLMVLGKKYMDEDLHKRGFKAVVQDVIYLATTPNLGDFPPFLGVIDLQGLTRKLKELLKKDNQNVPVVLILKYLNKKSKYMNWKRKIMTILDFSPAVKV
ncbi:hypothetical protein RND71_025594 [Anisodus tanguticus]|uniref:Cytochrome P450 n=1 Tax=Anisodus tanguticus TaxID=243964 RepID=A0AAE1RRL4_9SOLA|nr:hypothetical protein RND71_025594 [Anisodus tanguticus]